MKFGWRDAAGAIARPARVPPAPGLDLAGIELAWPAAYQWDRAGIWVDGLATELAAVAPLRRTELAQRHEGVVGFEASRNGSVLRVAIDYSDYERLLEEVAGAFDLVLKFQFRREGYGLEHVVPGGYVPSRERFYRLLPGARRRAARPPRFDVYGRFSLAYASDMRREAVGLLREQDRFGFEGDVRLAGYGAYLHEAAGAGVCLDLRGNGDLCHRLVEYLAIGACVVRPRPTTRLPVDLVDGRDLVYFAPDLSDLVEVCASLVADEHRRRRIGTAARAYFDAHLHRTRLAEHALAAIARRLG